jgi:hypothetical protein
MRSPAISVLILCLLTALGFGAGKPKTSQRIGDLVITLVEVEEPEHEGAPADHYPVAVRLQAKNVGKQALCVRFSATLKASFGLEYHDFSFGPHALDIRELLPGESTEGEYNFLVKTGAEPLQLGLKPASKSQTCDRGKDSSSAIWHGADQLMFDLVEPPGSKSQDRITPDSSLSERTGIRVFITGTKDDAHQANATKVFNDRCPLAQITTAKDKANYFVQLPPTSFRQSKNVVVVTNEAGDVIHSGATLNLGNAVKDACVAMMNDFSAKSKQ